MTARSDDRGITLIEVLVASLLMTVVMSVIIGVFISSTQTTRDVTDATSTSSRAQGAYTSIDTAIGSAQYFRVETRSNGDQLVAARVAGGSGSTLTWRCQAWYFSVADKTLRTKTAADATAVALPSAAQLANWQLLTEGVTRRGATPVFTLNDTSLAVSFRVTGSTGAATDISSTTAIPYPTQGATTC